MSGDEKASLAGPAVECLYLERKLQADRYMEKWNQAEILTMSQHSG